SIPGSDDTKSYFLIGDSTTYIQASVTNRRNNRVINSNILELRVSIPASMNGTFYASALADVEEGMLTKTVNLDSVDDAVINTTSGIESVYSAYLEESYLI